MPERNKIEIAQRKQLLQLHSMRVSACERAYRETQKQQQQAQQDVDERQASIDTLNQERTNAIEYGHSERVVASPLLSKSVHSRCYWVNYDLEKDQYYLSLDKGALDDAKKASNAARKKWLQAQHRESGAKSMLKQSQKNLESALENQQELEAEELMLSGEAL